MPGFQRPMPRMGGGIAGPPGAPPRPGGAVPPPMRSNMGGAIKTQRLAQRDARLAARSKAIDAVKPTAPEGGY